MSARNVAGAHPVREWFTARLIAHRVRYSQRRIGLARLA